MEVSDQNGQNRYQHHIVVTKTFRLRHRSPTSVTQSQKLKESNSNRRLEIQFYKILQQQDLQSVIDDQYS